MARKARKAPTGDGTYFKEGDFHVWQREVNGRRVTVKRKDYTAFKMEVAKRKKEIEELGGAPQQKELTLSVFVPQWIEAYIAPPRKKRRTYRNYLVLWNKYIKPHLGKAKLTKLTNTQVQLWLNKLQQEGAGSQVARAYMVLNRAFESAQFQGLALRNPCVGCEVPTAEAKPMRTLSPPEMKAFLAAAYTKPKNRKRPGRLRHLMRFDLSTGLRPGEVLGLLRINCDLVNGIVHVHTALEWIENEPTDKKKPRKQMEEGQRWELVTPKGRKYRSIVLEPQALKALRQQIAMVEKEKVKYAEVYEDNGLVFCTEIGTPLYPRNVQRQIDSLLKRAKLTLPNGQTKTGIDHIGFHDIRRTCLTNFANRGLPMHMLQAYAGHSSIQTTAKYYVNVRLEATRAAFADLKPVDHTHVPDQKVIHLPLRGTGT